LLLVGWILHYVLVVLHAHLLGGCQVAILIRLGLYLHLMSIDFEHIFLILALLLASSLALVLVGNAAFDVVLDRLSGGLTRYLALSFRARLTAIDARLHLLAQ
jgi:hypothetical protein